MAVFRVLRHVMPHVPCVIVRSQSGHMYLSTTCCTATLIC